MPTILYLTTDQLAKRARLTRSSFIAYRTRLSLSGGCEQWVHFKFYKHKQQIQPILLKLIYYFILKGDLYYMKYLLKRINVRK